MSKIWLSKIENGVPKMAPYTEADFHEWCKNPENAKKGLRTEVVKKPVSADMRAYYFAAVIPVIRSTCDQWTNLSSAEMHDVIKKLFFYFDTWNPKTKRMERFGRSVMSDSDWNNTTKASEFLMILQQYLTDCGLEMPSSEEYKAIRDGMNDLPRPIDYPEGNGTQIGRAHV